MCTCLCMQDEIPLPLSIALAASCKDPDPGTVCTLQQVSKACSAVVQGCSKGSLVVYSTPAKRDSTTHMRIDTSADDLARLRGLAAWCNKHGASQLAELHFPQPYAPPAEAAAHAAEAERIVLSCLRPAAAEPADEAALDVNNHSSRSRSSSSSSSQTAKHQLQLRVFTTNYLHSADMGGSATRRYPHSPGAQLGQLPPAAS
jgi:hypothetical protein